MTLEAWPGQYGPPEDRMQYQDWKDVQAAERIVTSLFVNGQGQQADRLVLMSSDKRDLGGWCQGAVVDVIVRTLKELR